MCELVTDTTMVVQDTVAVVAAIVAMIASSVQSCEADGMASRSVCVGA